MNILLFCTQLEAGGAQRAALRLSEFLRSKGYACETWFLYKKRDVFQDEEYINIVYPKKVKGIKGIIRLLINLRSQIKEYTPDVVITLGHNSNILVQFVCYFTGIKNRIASHRNPSWGYMSKSQQFVDKLFAKFGVYKKITAVSKSTKDSFKFYPDSIFKKITVIENGINFSKSSKKKMESRKLLNLPEDVFLIGNIGRLSKQKNHTLLIKSLSKLPDNICLTIAGEGEDREELTGLSEKLEVRDRVYFLGEISYNQIPEFLNAIDIFTMPSKFEGLSNALVEAMAAGKPVIASDIPSQRDVVENTGGESFGFLLDVDNSDAWVNKINEFYLEPKLIEEYQKLSFKRVEDFSLSKMGNCFLGVINE